MRRTSNLYAAGRIFGWLLFLALLASVAAHADTINLGNATISKANGGTAATTGGGAAQNLSHPYIICQSGSNSGASTTSASETNLGNCTIPANTIGAGGALRIRTLYSVTSSTNTKTVNIRLGTASCTKGSACSSGTQYLSFSINTTGFQNARCTTVIWNRAATNAQVGGAGTAGCNNTIGSGGGAPVTSAVDTTAASYINLDGNTNGTETITLEAYTVEVLPAGGN